MDIILANTAGFCFGVNNAIKIAEDMQDDEIVICTLGLLIHNEQVVNSLKEKGIRVISDINEAPEGSRVIIRAHGVTPEVYEEAEKRNVVIVDATCPYVKKIHKLVRQMHKDGYTIVIAGDRDHPEVRGINGWCADSAYIANTPEEADTIPPVEGKCCLVAQTTLTREKFDGIYDKLKEKCKSVVKFDTICSATSSRQEEAEKIARISDVMLVIGSRKSSNTQKLYEISSKYCKKTYLIETYGDLPPINVKEVQTLGITAGASTPERTIKEVIEKMDELNKQEKEMSFEEAFENSMVTLRSGEIVKGKIIGFNNAEIFVDLGYKSDGIIPVDEYSDDPDFKPETGVNVGDEIEVFIVRVNDGEGNVLLSKKKVDSMRSIEKIEEAYKNKTPVAGKVVEVTKGGVIVSVDGVRVFVPASQLSERYVKDLNEFMKQTIEIKIIEMNRQRRKVVGSRRVVLAETREQMEQEVWTGIEVGKKYEGTVKSLMDFGAFVDIGGVDGLVHVSEMAWTKVKHPSDILKVGDKVEVTVLDFDTEKKRISLSMKKEEDNPWFRVSERYKEGDIVKGTVVRLVPFGAFVELEKGLDGLVHISQISNVRIGKPGDVLSTGQEVEAKIIEVNEETKKISLSIKEVNPIDPEPAEEEEKSVENASDEVKKEEPKAAAADDIPSEHREELNNTIGDVIGSLGDIE
ncbi:MAG: bifunctional 4-hydroxy-3-methylbut-2-enyl diphosphate reductase/30S ribosomal protein S1 [Acetivibrionales bacterium]|jgi:small subunit ribosomal protein S1